jgi:hypothetical protein
MNGWRGRIGVLVPLCQAGVGCANAGIGRGGGRP